VVEVLRLVNSILTSGSQKTNVEAIAVCGLKSANFGRAKRLLLKAPKEVSDAILRGDDEWVGVGVKPAVDSVFNAKG